MQTVNTNKSYQDEKMDRYRSGTESLNQVEVRTVVYRLALNEQQTAVNDTILTQSQ